jgi:hypothetical protein
MIRITLGRFFAMVLYMNNTGAAARGKMRSASIHHPGGTISASSAS